MTHLHRFLSLPRAAALLLLLGGAPAAALAQDDAAQDQDEAAEDTAVAEDPAVAVVNGVPITTSEVMAYAETLPPEVEERLRRLEEACAALQSDVAELKSLILEL